MIQEDKELLLKDLCAKLPYGVKFACNKNIYIAKGINLIVTDEGNWEYAVTAKDIVPIEIDFIKPYLFPMSSMTKKEKLMYEGLMIGTDNISYMLDVIDWLNAHHFDYRNLIDKGLAIDATELNIY